MLIRAPARRHHGRCPRFHGAGDTNGEVPLEDARARTRLATKSSNFLAKHRARGAQCSAACHSS